MTDGIHEDTPSNLPPIHEPTALGETASDTPSPATERPSLQIPVPAGIEPFVSAEAVTDTHGQPNATPAPQEASHNLIDNSGETEAKLTIWGKAKEVGRIAKQEFKNANFKTQLLIASLIGMTAYEFGPGNETFTPLIGGLALGEVKGIGGVALTGVVTASTVLGQQLASGYLARRTVTQAPKVTERMYELMGEDKEDVSYPGFNELALPKRILNAFFLGSSYNIIREAVVNNEYDPDALRRIGRKSAALATLTTLAAGSTVEVVNQAFSDSAAVQFGVNVIAFPPTWILAATGAFAYDIVKNKRPSQPELPEVA